MSSTTGSTAGISPPGGDPAGAGMSPSAPRSRQPAASASPRRAICPRKPKPNPCNPRQEDEYEVTVPTVRDRVAQAAAKLVCEPIFEADFLDCSYGFRPKRSAHQALEAIRVEVNQGRTWVVDADIASFFDSIPPEVLRSALAERISDRRMMKLLMGWLRAGVWTGQALIHPDTGTAQGGGS